MNLTRPKALTVTGVSLVLILVAIAYAFKVPPFSEKAGEIKATDACPSLGSPSSAIPALKKILPQRPSYSFDDTVTGGSNTSALDYGASCLVTGESESPLLAARSRSMPAESAKGWLKWVKTTAINNNSVGSLTPFTAGDKAAASGNFAAIFLPCISERKNQSPQYNISLTVELGRPGDTSTRAGLIDLVESAASYAHKKARCNIPPKLSDR
ncbi:hypothetical protein OHO83_27585 [Streptomyces sp. NBC_00569]|uniref:hypothetical protein n=1 Tax=unclassified Streptomyces TaxID=2593676 RepID=UPI002251AABA|nr:MULTISPECIES: hypothetical protein [unclassified Streptomyces]MCX5437643.1 hypothetical protein [Streptomyces sp. NBC_00063]WUB95760.1 hypothetical protein OHO83_27585 [Streptomyces sp. NBC_00569]